MKAWFVLVFNSLYFLKEKCSCMLVQKIANTDLLQYMKSSREKSFAYYIIKICMPAASLVSLWENLFTQDIFELESVCDS